MVQIATHEQRQSLTQFFGDLESSTHRVKASTLICYSPVACAALTCSFLSRCVVMAEPRVLILGHSIRRLHEFVRLPTNSLRGDFDITTPMNLRWHGVGGRNVDKVIRYDLEIVRQFSPGIVILQLGTNDISDRLIRSALTVGSQLEDLTKLSAHVPTTASIVQNSVVQATQAIARTSGGNIVSPNVHSVPTTPLFSSVAIPLGSAVSDKIKSKIWANEFAHLGALLQTAVQQERFTVGLSATGNGSKLQITLEPASAPRKLNSI